MERVFSLIDGYTPVYEKLWMDICSMETPSDNKAALDAQSSYLEHFCLKRGFGVRVQRFPEAGNCLVIEMIPNGPTPRVALLAHMDTVHPVGSFGNPVVRKENGILYGPGVVDCKGGIAVALLAMEAVHQSGIKAPGLRLILNSDEEVSAKYSGEAGIQFLKKEAEGCVAAFNCETGIKGFLTVGRKGIVRMRINIHGRAAHAGNDYFQGISAIREAAYKILAIEKQSSQGGITYNCGVICGGKKSNVICDECYFEVDIRVKSKADIDKAIASIQCIADTSYVPGSTCSIDMVSVRPPMEHTLKNDMLLQKVQVAGKLYGLENILPMERGGGSDSAYTVEIGIPTVCSMGPTGLHEHTVQEQAECNSLPRRAKLLAAAIMQVDK